MDVKDIKGGMARAINALLAVILALGICMPAVTIAPKSAYASEGGQALDVAAYVEDNLDPDIADVAEEEPLGIFEQLRHRLLSTGGQERSGLAESGHYMYVSYLLAEEDEMAEGATIDSLYIEQAGAPVIGQLRSVAALYDVEGDYYAAFTGDMNLTMGRVATDWAFTEMNLDGEAIEGPLYDAEAGIAYVPKSLFENGEGEEIYRAVHQQMLIPYHLDAEEQATVSVETVNGNGKVTAVAQAQEIEADALDVTFEIPVATPETASQISLENIAVTVDDGQAGPFGDLVEGENAAYDSSTGVLTLALSPAVTGKVTVTVDEPSVVDKIMGTELAEAATAADLKTIPYYKFTDLDVDALKVGDKFSYLGTFFYGSFAQTLGAADAGEIDAASKHSEPYGYTWTGNDYSKGLNHTISLADWVMNGESSGFTASQIIDQAYENGTFDTLSQTSIAFSVDMPANPDGKRESRHGIYGGFDWHFEKTSYTGEPNIIAMYCGHSMSAVGVPEGSWRNGSYLESNGKIDGTVNFRVLAKGKLSNGNDYVVLAFVSPRSPSYGGVEGQAGTAIYKFEVDGKAKIDLKKSSALPNVTDGNPLYTLEGAQYGVYATQNNAKNNVDKLGTLTVKADGTSNTLELDKGTYYVKETKAPEGYEADEDIYTVEGSGAVTVEVKDTPMTDPTVLQVWKSDVLVGDALPEGSATLEGAEFTFKYYDGYYTEDSLPATPARTWVLKTDANGVVNLTRGNELKVSGDDFYVDTFGNITLPLGTITAIETKAPTGYLLGTHDAGPTLFVSHVVEGENGRGESRPVNYDQEQWGGIVTRIVTQENSPERIETPIAGGVEVQKLDKETVGIQALGGATLEGAEFSVYLAGATNGFVMVDGVRYNVGDVVKVIATDGDAHAITGMNDLPYADYTIKETKAPEGYLLNKDWSYSFQVREDGFVFDAGDIANQVKRTDITFNKIDLDKQEIMPNVLFKVEQVESGEVHYVLTDENGVVDTSSAWWPHDDATNANDAAVSEDGTVDESKLTAEYGVWFAGFPGSTAAPDNSLGALPYGTYRFTEMRTSANEGKNLITFTYNSKRDDVKVDLGTKSDSSIDVATQFAVTDTGLKMAPAGKVKFTDVVEVDGLEKGKSYKLTATIHVRGADGSDEGELLDPDGNAYTAELEFTAKAKSGTYEVDFGEVDVSAIAGKAAVCFEDLSSDGLSLAAHADIEDADQTVTIPEIGTTLTGSDGVTAILDYAENIAVKDTVAYTGLIPGIEYTAACTLVDKATGEEVKDADGNAVTLTKAFTPDTADGSFAVEGTVAGKLLAGKTLVAFEKVSYDGIEYAWHADIDDVPQTITVPAVEKYINKDVHQDLGSLDETFTYDVMAFVPHNADTAIVTDELVGQIAFVGGAESVRVADMGMSNNHRTNGAYSEASADATVTAEGTPIAANVSIEGQKLTVSIADAKPYRSHWLRVTFDAKATVDDGYSTITNNGTVLSERDHTGIPNQAKLTIGVGDNPNAWSGDSNIVTVRPPVPELGTTLVDKDSGTHMSEPAEKDVLVDTVAYKGMPVGKEVTFTGVLYDKAAKKVIEGVSATKTVTIEKADGTVELEFNLASTKYAGKQLVAFEYAALADGTPMGSHEDPEDPEQTVSITSLRTSAAGSSGQTIEAGKSAKIVDTVTYSGFMPGKKYTVEGVLMSKATGKALEVNGKQVTAKSAEFTAAKSSGTVKVEFTFDASALSAGDALVVFETGYTVADEGPSKGKKVKIASHADINDAAQTVTVAGPSDTPSGKYYSKTGVNTVAILIGVACILTAAVAAGAYGLHARRIAKGAPGHEEAPEK